jgi:hypothetical protein
MLRFVVCNEGSKPMPKHKRLIQISAFWKNDKPGGLGVSYTENVDVLFEIMRAQVAAYNTFDRPTIIADLQSQMEEYRQERLNGRTIPDDMLVILVANIMFLEEVGALAADEFNGMMYAYLG